MLDALEMSAGPIPNGSGMGVWVAETPTSLGVGIILESGMDLKHIIPIYSHRIHGTNGIFAFLLP